MVGGNVDRNLIWLPGNVADKQLGVPTTLKEEWPELLLCQYETYLLFRCSFLRGGSRGRVQGVRTPPPPGMTCGRFLINTVQSLDRHTKSAPSFDMYSQQFTLYYFLVKSPLLFAFKFFDVFSELVVHPLLRKILDPPLFSDDDQSLLSFTLACNCFILGSLH